MRSYSMDSNASLSSITESLHQTSPEVLSLYKPPLLFGVEQSNSSGTSPTHSLDNRTSPASQYDLDIPSTIEQMQDFSPPALHSRTVSDAEVLSHPSVPSLYAKKSLPDLRRADVPTIEPIQDSSIFRNDLHFAGSRSGEDPFNYLSSPSMSVGPKSVAPYLSSDTPDVSPAVSPRERVTSVTKQRNSYFRRLSALPLPHALPQHLTVLAESARSFLFAMCQIYQSLEQYAALIVDDGFPVALRQVLDPAQSGIRQFVQALKQFDFRSRISLPAPSICHHVLERCKDCATAFGKAINVLVLRLRVVPGEDLRFSRWALLEMYAATAEIAGAWTSMQSHAENLKLYLRSTDSTASMQVPDMKPSLELSFQHTLRAGIPSGIRTARRHAGSFSSKDVEIGKKLPSYDLPPTMTGGVLSGPAPHIPMLRTPKRQVTAPVSPFLPKISSSLPFWYQNISDERSSSHTRQGSLKSISYFSPSSSPALLSKSSDSLGSSRRKVEFEALNAIQEAVETAPRVFDMVADMLPAGAVQNEREVRAILEQAHSVTRKISDIITKIHDGDMMWERRILQEDAQLFLKVIDFFLVDSNLTDRSNPGCRQDFKYS